MMNQDKASLNKPTAAYVYVTWSALAIGVVSYFFGLWKATIMFNEKGFYMAVFLLAMFSAVTLQKTVRDKEKGLPVTSVFLGMSWAMFFISVALLVIGLVRVNMLLSEKGFYGIAFVLSLFAVVTVQKNFRDLGQGQDISKPVEKLRNENQEPLKAQMEKNNP